MFCFVLFAFGLAEVPEDRLQHKRSKQANPGHVKYIHIEAFMIITVSGSG